MRRRSNPLLVLALAGVIACATGAAPSAAVGAPPRVVRIPVAGAVGYAMAAGLGAMWAARTDEVNSVIVYRINPITDTVSRVRRLDFAGADLAVGYGSLWITDYYGNAVWRLAPSGAIEARIGVGLQPEVVHLAFGSVWVANHHGQSVSRVDPHTDSVVATDSAGDPTQFRDGPQGITDDGHRLYVGSSNLFSLQAIDPATDVTTTPPATDDQFCGALTWAGGHVWSGDLCSNTLWQLTAAGAVSHRHVYGPITGQHVTQVLGTAPYGGQLLVAVDRDYDEDRFAGTGAAIERRDARTGALLGSVSIGGDASSGVFVGYGSAWVPDVVHRVITRVELHGGRQGPPVY